MSESYTLEYPVTVDDETVTEVTIRRPKVGDSLALEKGKKRSEIEKEVLMISRLTSLTETAVAELDEADYANIGKIIVEMRGGKPKDEDEEE